MPVYFKTKLLVHDGMIGENESLFKDGNGFVSTSEIKFVLSRLGVEFSDEELGEMVRKLPRPCKCSIYKMYVRRGGSVGFKTVKLCMKCVFFTGPMSHELIGYVFLQVQEADIDGDQHVSFEEFRDIFNEG